MLRAVLPRATAWMRVAAAASASARASFSRYAAVMRASAWMRAAALIAFALIRKSLQELRALLLRTAVWMHVVALMDFALSMLRCSLPRAAAWMRAAALIAFALFRATYKYSRLARLIGRPQQLASTISSARVGAPGGPGVHRSGMLAPSPLSSSSVCTGA